MPHKSWWWPVRGLLLLVTYGVISGLSQSFIYGEGHLDRPILLVVGLLLLASIIYGICVASVIKHPHTIALWMVLLVAVLSRTIFLPSQPIQEDDIYRYIWDGQVTRSGHNPYQYAPAAVAATAAQPLSLSRDDLQDIASLVRGQRERQILSRVNHPHVSTIYPPFAQYVFALTQYITPWSVRGMRTCLALFDLLCIVLLLLLLRHAGRPTSWVLIYAWSPLIIKEFANSGHMDSLAIAGVLCCVWLLLKHRWVLAALTLAIAVASKYYPLILVPIVGQWMWVHDRKAFARAAAVFVCTLGMLFGPFLMGAGSQVFRGLSVYAQDWRMNASIFSLVEWCVALIHAERAALIARMIVGMTVLGVVAWVMRWQASSTCRHALLTRCWFILGTLVLLSPVQNPWYLCWVLPLLCIYPLWPWLLLTGLILLYYAGFYIEYHAADPTQWWMWLRWAEHAPFYVALFACAWWQRRRQAEHDISPQRLKTGDA